MKRLSYVLLGLSLCLSVYIVSCSGTKKAGAGGKKAMTTIAGTKSDTMLTGTVMFEENGNKVKMKLVISVPKMANKTVAVHIHENGDCGNMGMAAGGHWNPTSQNHGKWGSGSFHLGDIGNVSLDGSGSGNMELDTNLWEIGTTSLNNVVGKSIIVHSGVDDYTSQPSGNAGSRIGCGVIASSN